MYGLIRKEKMIDLQNLKEIRRKDIKVSELFQAHEKKLNLEMLNGEIGFKNLIQDKTINRPGFVLSGYVELFTFYRVQILGNTEIRFLNHLDYKERLRVAKRLFDFPMPCLIVTNNNLLDDGILALATERNIPVLRSSLSTDNFIQQLSDYLDNIFSPQIVVHGTFLDVYGVGILFVGRSGIGKSEIALDLVERGHRLVADDVVSITKKGEQLLIGHSNQLVRHYMEIRGLGLINVQNIFGIRAVRYRKRIEVLVELEDWQDINKGEYNRTGLDEKKITLLGVDIPHIKLPIFPGKNVTVISETIALNYILKHHGYDPSQQFMEKLQKTILDKTNSNSNETLGNNSGFETGYSTDLE